MTYAVGIDLGTTFTSAALARDGRVETVMFEEGAEVPSVVALDDHDALEFGTAAVRRLVPTPDRVVTEFKRRLGSPDPIVLGSLRCRPEDLMAELLVSIVTRIAVQQGRAPGGVVVCHPAAWGVYKRNLLAQAIGKAFPLPIAMISEPEAAATWYAQKETLRPGGLVAVYDLGGGTFDVAIMRRTDSGFEFVAPPSGDERLGGIDFDDLVMEHVEDALGDQLAELNFADPMVQATYANLRLECTKAKVALSAATDVSIPVLLPGVSTVVRLTRVEFEDRIRPYVERSVELFADLLDRAAIPLVALDAVLLVGGSSRVPLVKEILRSTLDVQVRVDAHPKHAVALGAAWFASATHLASTPPVPLRRSDVSDHVAHGLELRHERRFDEADAELTEALQLQPDDPLALGIRADVRRLLQRTDEALADVERALSLDPDHVLARTVRAALHRSARRLPDALVDLTRALESQPEAAWPLALRADVLLQLGRTADAAQNAELALRHDPDHVFALGRRGELHRLAGEFPAARRCFERALELESNLPWVLERVQLLDAAEARHAP